ncbi:MAG: hypothetical protein OSJ27_05900 [Candidatus Gastranaerophilales bacterium]|nr:hypothetical protein [Candidatus Gastranaerophilales bacterium]
MEFLSPLSDIFTDKKEFGSLIRQAKDCQLNYSLSKIKEFSFLDNEVIDEVMPKGTPEALLNKRRNIKNVQKRV